MQKLGVNKPLGQCHIEEEVGLLRGGETQQGDLGEQVRPEVAEDQLFPYPLPTHGLQTQVPALEIVPVVFDARAGRRGGGIRGRVAGGPGRGGREGGFFPRESVYESRGQEQPARL